MHYIADMYHRFGEPANSKLPRRMMQISTKIRKFVNQTARRHIPVDRKVKVVIYTTAIIGPRRVKSQNRDV